MSKKTQVGIVPSSNSSYNLLPFWKIGFLEGRILTIIDALGLQEKQGTSVKNLLSNEVWSVLNGDGVIPVPNEIANKLEAPTLIPR